MQAKNDSEQFSSVLPKAMIKQELAKSDQTEQTSKVQKIVEAQKIVSQKLIHFQQLIEKTGKIEPLHGVAILKEAQTEIKRQENKLVKMIQ